MRKGRYATLLLQGAVLYEYLLGVFWVTDFRAEDPRSVKVAKLHELPPGHWYHLPTCDCGACGFRESQARCRSLRTEQDPAQVPDT